MSARARVSERLRRAPAWAFGPTIRLVLRGAACGVGAEKGVRAAALVVGLGRSSRKLFRRVMLGQSTEAECCSIPIRLCDAECEVRRCGHDARGAATPPARRRGCRR